MCKTILLDAPNLGDIEKQYLVRAIESGFVSSVGPYVPEFEEQFAEYVGAKYAVSVQSGTAAIHIALYASGIGKGDEVIVPSLTFIATINPILYVGARPVIVDVNRDTWNISPEEIEKAITKHTKVIIPVHIYGNPCAMDRTMAIANKHNLYVIEDATESLGATYKGKQTGTFGHFGCFSFNGNKILTTGGGGMVVTNDKKRAKHIRFLVNQARENSKSYYYPEMGFNYRMTNLEAAIGLAQLRRIELFLERKRAYRRIYEQAFKDLSFVTFPQQLEDSNACWWLSCVEVETKADQDELMAELKKRGIQSRRVFWPTNRMPYLRGFGKPCPNADSIYRRGICLPSSTLNSHENILEAAEEICDVFVSFAR